MVREWVLIRNPVLEEFLHTVNLACTTGAHLRDTEMGLKVDLGTSWRLLKQNTQVSAQETKYCCLRNKVDRYFQRSHRKAHQCALMLHLNHR